jgi:hypothetical protein
MRRSQTGSRGAKGSWRKQKKIRLAVVIALLLLVVSILLGVRIYKIKQMSSIQFESNDLVMGASLDSAYYTCTNQTGIFYLKGNFMHYCDYETKIDSVLCDKVNCTHAFFTCNAYAEDATAFGFLDGKIYIFIKNAQKNTYDLTEMTVSGGERKVIYSLGLGSYEEGAFYLNNFGENVYYGYGKAYFVAEYCEVGQDADDQTQLQLMMVDLTSGQAQVLAESKGYSLYHGMKLQAISDSKVIYSVNQNTEALSGEALEEMLAADSDKMEAMVEEIFPEESESNFWKEYLDQFYETYGVITTTDMTFTLQIYDIESGETATLWSGTCGYLYDGAGVPCGWWEPCFCVGWYENEIILNFWNFDESEDHSIQNELVAMSIRNGETDCEILLDDYYSLVGTSFGSMNHGIFDHGKILYLKRLEDQEKVEYAYYDLAQNKVVQNYIGTASDGVDILGETEKFFVCQMTKKDQSAVYLLDKDAYYNGDLDTAEYFLW